MRSVYIHIPFCNSICTYCDFCKFVYYSPWVNEYLNLLKKEIEENYDNDIIKTIYIGGGTPSSLSEIELLKLFDIIKIFKLKENAEFTFEMNICDITHSKLELLKKMGVNRISVGIQSFDKNNLKFLNRKHNKKEIKFKIDMIKKHGFNNINVDFMYALPIESYTTFLSDLHKFVSLGVNHISTYSLIIEPNTVLDIKNIKPISEDLDNKMYKKICKTLRHHGYIHYEVSNFAKPGYESIHNLNYWNNDEYYGFGLSAHGYISELRYENTRNFNKYLKGMYRSKELVISKRENMENEIILGLRKLKGINIKTFFEKFKVNIQEVFNINECLKKKYLILEGDYIRISEEKIYVMNEILNIILQTEKTEEKV